MSLESTITTLMSVLVGGLITWFVAKKYYEKASKELRNEADGLKALTRFLGIKLHESEIIKLPLDENGKPTYNQTIRPESIT